MIDTANFNVDTSNFTVRKPRLKPWQLVAIGVLIALTLFLSSHAASVGTRNFVSIVVSILVVAFLYLIQKYIYDEKTATEFQCLIFSGSMRANSLVSLILNPDGSIYYLDSRYTMNFEGAKSTHTIEQFMSTIGVPDIDKVTVYDALTTAKVTEFSYSFNNQPLKLGIYPIARPHGFFALNLMAV